jgi:CBS domain containing-hemolysin-like protein
MWGDFLADHAWQLTLMLLLLGCSGFFSMSETAYFNLSRAQLLRLRSGGPPARLAASLMRSPQRTLNSMLLGNMIVNTAYAAIAAVAVLDLQHSLPAWETALVSLVPLVVLILLSEVAPKIAAIAMQETWVQLAAAPLTIVQKIFSPTLWLLETTFVQPLVRIVAPHDASGGDITADELGAVLHLCAERGLIGHEASSLMQEIVSLTDLRVRDVMVPRVDMVAYDMDGPTAGLLKLFRQTRLHKCPVYQRDIDNIRGVVHARTLLLNPSAPLSSMVQPVPFVPESANLERVLLQFRVTGTQMAIVVDEYGGTAGMVSLEDVLEQIVGDIPDPDETARGPAVERIGDAEYRIDGNLPIHEWTEAFRVKLAEPRISTMAGFVTSLMGSIPRAGDSVDYRNLRFTVESVRRHRIDKLHVRLLEKIQ